MRQLFSVWLVPAKADKEYLSKIINTLGENYDAPTFTPHLTLFGNITIELEHLKRIVNEVVDNFRVFKVKKTKVSQSELFFKTVFIEFELSEELKTLFIEIARRTDNRDLSTFKPHISLIYKVMAENEKIDIIRKLDIKDDFEISKVVINAPKKGDNDFLDVKKWQEVYEKPLVF